MMKTWLGTTSKEISWTNWLSITKDYWCKRRGKCLCEREEELYVNWPISAPTALSWRVACVLTFHTDPFKGSRSVFPNFDMLGLAAFIMFWYFLFAFVFCYFCKCRHLDSPWLRQCFLLSSFSNMTVGGMFLSSSLKRVLGYLWSCSECRKIESKPAPALVVAKEY